MISIAPVSTTHAAYLQGLQATLEAVGVLAGLPQLPAQTLALNATFYLDAYLPSAAYAGALQAALAAASAERHGWRVSTAGDPAGCDALRQLTRADTSRPALYRWLFERAVASGQPQRLVLAQHACEIAEVLDDQALPAALRFGLLALPAAPVAAPEQSSQGGVLPSSATLLEGLSRALLCRRIDAATFVERLLALHAANRAAALTERGLSAPLALAARAVVPLLSPATMQHVPKRLRVTQPCELARRALHPLPGLGPGRAVLAVEAGLVEAETLSSGQQLLLLAALDQALAA